MKIAVVRETASGEQRVALIPAAIPRITKAGFEILVETGAGEAAGFADRQYVDKGAKIAASREEAFAADIVFQVRAAGANPLAEETDFPFYRPGQTIIGLCDPLGNPAAAAAAAQRGVTLYSLELLPRITRAQSMDVLSSQATIAGYRAVLLGATAMSKILPMLMTAAGTLIAAKVLVIGAGVAGLQAIATARRLGALVSAYDVRAAVKEQIQSLGARFVEIEVAAGAAEGTGGYAKQMDEDFYRRQRAELARVIAESDMVISTAAVPGKKAPVLITAEMVAGMAPGAVIVDVAAASGGNCELTQPGTTVVEKGIKILGPLNLAAEVPHHASQLFAKNIEAFLLHQAKEGRLTPSQDDEIVRETLITCDGRVVHPRVKELLDAATT